MKSNGVGYVTFQTNFDIQNLVGNFGSSPLLGQSVAFTLSIFGSLLNILDCFPASKNAGSCTSP
jgi:hypothetical protein